MALRTVTYDTATHKICPIEPTDDMCFYGFHDVSRNTDDDDRKLILKFAIAAAPEYQEPTKDE